ncbi:MAG: hypothetical protein IPK16_11905 [Anaerolineales bacterium]|nr:hypothetical protein [Anaerolineales bacterium]
MQPKNIYGASPGAYLPAKFLKTFARTCAARRDGRRRSAYWKAYQLGLYVDNQETWQRCKGGDHVRRIAITGPDDDSTCSHCKAVLGKEFLVARVPELPHKECTSPRGCRCKYEPVLETIEEIPLTA